MRHDRGLGILGELEVVPEKGMRAFSPLLF
jgi:hypothetical protein